MRRIAICMVVGALVLAGCGGGSDDDDAADGGTTDAPENGGEERPEGRWSFVRTQLERSDDPDFDPGLSIVQLAELDPSCDTGPCDIEMTPDGVDGTYLPEGLVVADPAPPDPRTLVWDEGSEMYTIDFGDREADCTTADLKTVDAAYQVSTTVTVSFVPPEGDGPARLEGTYERTSTSTPAGETAGCTTYSESGAFIGSPTGALGEVDPVGEYVTTEFVASIEPNGERPPGFAGLLPPTTIAEASDGVTIRGVLGVVAELDDSTATWNAVAELTQPCGESQTVDGLESTETWTDLSVIAATPDGLPVLAGPWKLEHEPTDAGAAADCTASTNTGYVVLVPASFVA